MKRLTQREERIMHILWQLKKAFVKEIIAEMEAPKPPVTTVSSIVRKLEEEGFIGHESFGRTHRYFPLIEKADYRKSAFRRMMDNYFGGSPKQVLSFFMKEEKINPTELNELLKELKEDDE